MHRNRAIRGTLNTGATLGEYASKRLAVPAAMASVAGEGNVLERSVSGVYNVGNAIYNAAKSYLTPTYVNDAVNTGAAKAFDLVGNGFENIGERPGETAAIALGTYAAMEAIPWITKRLRNRANNRARSIDDHVE